MLCDLASIDLRADQAFNIQISRVVHRSFGFVVYRRMSISLALANSIEEIGTRQTPVAPFVVIRVPRRRAPSPMLSERSAPARAVGIVASDVPQIVGVQSWR